MIQETTLPNGARLLTERVPSARSAALGFFVKAGSRHEAAGENGAAHFIEHMLFKGTERRTAAKLAMDMDAIGGQVNAYTTKEYTCFYARTLDAHLDRGLDILSDMLFHSRFTQEDVEVERGVILEEIGMCEDNPEDLAAERLTGAVYRGSSLARPILGTEATLSGMTGEQLRRWHRAHYRPGALVVSLVGSFTGEQADRLRALLAGLEPGPAPVPAKPAVLRPAVTARRKAIEQNHVILAWPSLTCLDERRYALLLFNSLLGGGCSSRLFQEIREKRGLCYTVYSYLADHADTGLLGVYTAVSPSQEAAALDTVRQVVSELADRGPTGEELDRAREQAKANLLMSGESVQSRMEHMGADILRYGRVREIGELLERYDAVTREQLRDLAQEIFVPSRTSLSAVGRVRTVSEYRNWLAGEQDPWKA